MVPAGHFFHGNDHDLDLDLEWDLEWDFELDNLCVNAQIQFFSFFGLPVSVLFSICLDW